MKNKWYLQSWIIGICFAFWWVYGVPLVLGIILLILKNKQSKENNMLFEKNQELIKRIGAERYVDVTEKVNLIESNLLTSKNELKAIELNIEQKNSIITQLNIEIERLQLETEKREKQNQTQINKLRTAKELYKSCEYSFKNFLNLDPGYHEIILPDVVFEKAELLSPSVVLKLHSMDVRDLRKAFRENDRLITRVLKEYLGRYTTKANRAIYELMVIALKAELQNILYNLKYEKLDTSIEDIKKTSQKYLKIAAEGNQSIAGTLTKFIGEIEYLFINAAKIEYNYYVKKEQAKQEQLALRQQMREEAEERRALEKERKKIEFEEEKYNIEIAKTQDLLSSTTDDLELENLRARILELQVQLSDVTIKKEEISKLQKGMAGNVYIISNLGSFGDNVFKIGMTRRINPQERINELGSASVPFRFDVHSFIFSDNAVELENKLHEKLHSKRLNKVNSRKEFFVSSVDKLEELVAEIEPTAEFNKTMLAEEYRQTLSLDVPYDKVYDDDDDYDDDEDE